MKCGINLVLELEEFISGIIMHRKINNQPHPLHKLSTEKYAPPDSGGMTPDLYAHLPIFLEGVALETVCRAI